MDWIKVEDRLPDFHIPVLVTGLFKDWESDPMYAVPSVCRRMMDGTWTSDECFDTCDHEHEFDIRITHWMPLPELPKIDILTTK